MAALNINRVEFIRSAAGPEQFIRSSIPAVVFAGKSNVGKSSVINCVLNRKNFARTGSTPGKTVHINYFLIDGKVYFLDLPGYGFASVSREEKARWGVLMEQFFSEKDLYSLGVLIVDARHEPTNDDIGMAALFHRATVPYLVLANKTDKLKNSVIEQNLEMIRQKLALEKTIPLLPFSAQNGQGRDILLSYLTKLV
jgi:GTP-binding protein